VLRHPTVARYLRLTVATPGAALWEWSIDGEKAQRR
jgi:hypothetical protein